MLSSKEALEKIVDEIKWTHNDGKTLTRFDKEQVDIIEKELNALEIIKNKKVNLFHIWIFNDYEQYKLHYPFSEYNAREDMLNQEEFDFLKEVFEYD